MLSHKTLSDENIVQLDNACPTFKDGGKMTKDLALGILIVFPTLGSMWLIDMIERFTGRIITGSFENVGDQRMYSK